MNRASAIKSLIRTNTTLKEIEHWRTGLKNDGYTNDNLPTGWMRKKRKHLRLTWISPEFTVSRGERGLLRYLEEKFGIDNIKVERAFAELMQDDEKGQNRTEWKDDNSLPPGWKMAFYKNSFPNSRATLKFLSPEGKCLSGRTGTLRHMIAHNYEEEAINKIKYGLEMEGFIESVFLPAGWRVRTQHFKSRQSKQPTYFFLSPRFNIMKSVKKVLAYLHEQGTSKKVMNIIAEHFVTEKKSQNKIKNKRENKRKASKPTEMSSKKRKKQ